MYTNYFDGTVKEPPRDTHTETQDTHTHTHISPWGIAGFKCRGSMLRGLMCVYVMVKSQQHLLAPCATCSSSLSIHTHTHTHTHTRTQACISQLFPLILSLPFGFKRLKYSCDVNSGIDFMFILRAFKLERKQSYKHRLLV